MIKGIHSKYESPVRFTPLAVAALAAAVYFLDAYILTSLIVAAAVHELGHIIALNAAHFRINGFAAELGGLRIDYSGEIAPVFHALAALAGPLAGLAFAFLCSFLARVTGISWFVLTAGISLALSLFNLLPVLPLGGGRTLAAALSALFGVVRAERTTLYFGRCFSFILLAVGLWLYLRSGGVWLMLFAVYFILSSIEKTEKVMYNTKG